MPCDTASESYVVTETPKTTRKADKELVATSTPQYSPSSPSSPQSKVDFALENSRPIRGRRSRPASPLPSPRGKRRRDSYIEDDRDYFDPGGNDEANLGYSYGGSAMFPGVSESGKGILALVNVLLLVASLILIGAGAALMGFYRIHMLDVISVEFMVVPILMTVSGVVALLTALLGFYVALREDSCLMVTYTVAMAVELLLLAAGIVCSVRLLFEMQTGLYDADIVPELSRYETNNWIRHKWDTLQSKDINA